MGQLKNPESWESGLSDLPAVLADLTKWIDSVEYDLTVHKWFDDGRSGNPVALVLRTGHRTPEQLVMKFCGPGLRSRIRQASASWGSPVATNCPATGSAKACLQRSWGNLRWCWAPSQSSSASAWCCA